MSTEATVRPPAVAGAFYPDAPEDLRRAVERHLAGARGAAGAPAEAPKALIAPHAGYVFSGDVAARAYARVAVRAGAVSRVVLLGPAHRVPVRGLAAPAAGAFATPLGEVEVDREALARLADLPQVQVSDRAHAAEHSLEVHLPFLQVLLGDFRLVPLVVGDASPQEVGEVLERLWGGDETLVVISTDLSHYLDYESARAADARTDAAIRGLRYEDLRFDDACGRVPVQGLLWLARRRGLHVTSLDLRNSGDTAGPRDRVVGYASYAVA